VRALGAVAAVVVILGVVVYFSFVNPSMVANASESRAWSSNCVDNTDALTEDESITNLLTAPGVRSLGIRWATGRAAALFADSEANAQKVMRELRGYLRQGGVSAARVNHQILIHGSDVLVFALHAPSEADIAMVGQCVYEIDNNRWGGWTGLNTKSVGRPFMASTK
jgi:hypothetical protein